MEAEDADAALILLQSDQHVDIALIDMQMPKVDGVMLAERIRALPQRRELALLLLSSGLQDLELGLLRALGISACLYKPVPPRRLFRALALALSNRGKLVQAGLLDVFSDGVLPSGSQPTSRPPVPLQKVNQEARLLLVDDNNINRDVAEVALETLGHTVDMAFDGQEAVAEIVRAWQQGHPYRLILMDCQMPVMDGYEATRRIRQWEVENRIDPTIIVAMTAHAMEGDREKCLAAGMNDYLSKPVQLEVLQNKLNQWLRPTRQGKSRVAETAGVFRPSGALVWDASALLKLVRQKEERLVKLLQSFLAGLDAVEKEIVQALHSGDHSFAKRQIHGLKGSSANLGARALPAFLGELEIRLTNEPQVDPEQEILALQSHLIRLRGAMQSYLDISYRPL